MNFDFAGAINPHLEQAKFTQAVQLAETKLEALPASPFHQIIGRSLLDQTDDLCSWIDDFYKVASATISVGALYFEMNEFDINTDEWYIDGFAYQQDGSLSDQEWLANSDEVVGTSTCFVLLGYERLQEAFDEVETDTDELQDARDWCEQIVLTRYRQLMQAAHQKARDKELAWATLPVYCTEHGYDFLTRSTH